MEILKQNKLISNAIGCKRQQHRQYIGLLTPGNARRLLHFLFTRFSNIGISLSYIYKKVKMVNFMLTCTSQNDLRHLAV